MAVHTLFAAVHAVTARPRAGAHALARVARPCARRNEEAPGTPIDGLTP